MSHVWQRRFLTWGILLSVFGTRVVLPIIIVSIVAFVSPIEITSLALYNPEEYTRLLTNAEAAIKSFGGAFLLMVSLKYFFNVGKQVHWFAIIEQHLVKWGRVQAIEIAIALLVLFTVSLFAHEPVETVIRAGIVGIVLFVLTEGVAHGLGVESKGAIRTGLMLFIYLNLIDSAFSLDGVVAAFALTTSLPIIIVGLGIGAYFVRTMTIYLVHKKTLESLKYLEHGAHWAVLGLALTMFAGLIGLSYFSSLRERKGVYIGRFQ